MPLECGGKGTSNEKNNFSCKRIIMKEENMQRYKCQYMEAPKGVATYQLGPESKQHSNNSILKTMHNQRLHSDNAKNKDTTKTLV